MNLNFYEELKKKLEVLNVISYEELREIMDAFQIASGQGFAIGKTKALLDYLKTGRVLTVEHFDYSDQKKLVSTVNELANIYMDIDNSINLPTDKDFKEYFT
ncbi:MAG: hypothetical protein AB7O73_15725 [Bacteroidia bacterium]